jgi:hypothetical protein
VTVVTRRNPGLIYYAPSAQTQFQRGANTAVHLPARLSRWSGGINKEIKKRLAQLPEFKPRVTTGYLKRYIAMVTSASTGAVFTTEKDK